MQSVRTTAQRMMNLWRLIHDPEAFFTRMSAQGHLTLFPLHRNALLIAHPTYAHQALADTFNLGVVKLSMERLGELLGKNIITTEGGEWQDHREAIQPALHGAVLKEMATTMTQEAEGIVGSWKKELKGGSQLVQIERLMASVTMRIMTKCILGDQLTSNDMNAISYGTTRGLEVIFPQMNAPFVVPRWIPTRANRDLKRARDNLQSVSSRLITLYQDKNSDQLPVSLIRFLLGSKLSPEAVEANVRAMFIAGHETTSVALTWAWYVLSQYPGCYTYLKDNINVTGIAREVLRLYPPAWLTAREVLKPVSFGSHHLEPGDVVFIFILGIHRNPEWWGSDVLEFRPDRWSGTYATTNQPGRWLPFGGGPRICAGANFALTEMKIFMQTFAQAGGRFTLADPTHVPTPAAGFTRKPKDPLYMRMQFSS